MPIDIAEGVRRNKQYEMLDDMLTNSHGGDYMGMHVWVMSKHCIEQFETKFKHDQFVTDFVNWSRNRGITYE